MISILKKWNVDFVPQTEKMNELFIKVTIEVHKKKASLKDNCFYNTIM